jgi:hypothetical protein
VDDQLRCFDEDLLLREQEIKEGLLEYVRRVWHEWDYVTVGQGLECGESLQGVEVLVVELHSIPNGFQSLFWFFKELGWAGIQLLILLEVERPVVE